MRAFYDDGSPLGSRENDECQIDSIAQSWSVLSGAGDPERSRMAMEAVDQRLVRREHGLIQPLIDGSAFDGRVRPSAWPMPLDATHPPLPREGSASPATYERLLRQMTEELKTTQDLNIQPRLDAMYEDVQRMVDELVALGSLRDQMEQIYSETPPADIPWNIETPPKALVELVDSGQIQPCKAIDLGCGAGNYAIYLASPGFDVTGVDISPSAIALAEANTKQKGVACRFVAADVVGGLPEISETFDFAYDWSLLHHVFPIDRKRYVETVCRLLAPGGKYLSVCLSEQDAGFGGTGRIRRTPLGTMLYFSSEDELRDLFAPDFDIKTLQTLQVEGLPVFIAGDVNDTRARRGRLGASQHLRGRGQRAPCDPETVPRQCWAGC